MRHCQGSLCFSVMLLPAGLGVFPPNPKLVKMGAVCCLQSCPSAWHRAVCSKHRYLWVKWVDTWGSVLRTTDTYLRLKTEADISILFTREYYSAITEWNHAFAATWVGLEMTILSEIGRLDCEDRYQMVSLICGI